MVLLKNGDLEMDGSSMVKRGTEKPIPLRCSIQLKIDMLKGREGSKADQ